MIRTVYCCDRCGAEGESQPGSMSMYNLPIGWVRLDLQLQRVNSSFETVGFQVEICAGCLPYPIILALNDREKPRIIKKGE
jgi:hypothetical protein